MPSTRSEEDNYNCFLKIMNVAVSDSLREIFKQEWDKHYGAPKGVWDDTCISGNELYNMERTRPHAKPYLNSYQSGKRSDWDCSTLSDAILYSNALKKHLAPHVSNKVDELRVLRNNLTHKFGSQHAMSDAAFDNAYKKVKNCFKVLKLSSANVERISKGKHFTRFGKMTYVCLTIFIIGLISSLSYHWFTNAFEDLSLFKVLPTRPVHLVANRSQTVDAIIEELHSLSFRNSRSLTYLYISGNPGSGKSQLARLVGQRYGTNIPGSWFYSSASVFVMTLNGRSLDDILESYVDFARRVDCNENNIASIRNSNQTTTKTKIQSLKAEISKTLRNFRGEYTWLLIVDNVAKLSEISLFLPQLEDEDWQGGQVLITTQDMSSVPPNSSFTVHISVSQGMDPVESCEFLTVLSRLVENQDLVRKVAKELDYQPLALASAAFYVKIVRESKAFSQFTWNDYLQKLDEGKRNLTEMKLSEVNEPAYSLTMSTAVLLAVTTFAERDSVLKHAFAFLSYVSHEVLSLQVVVSYVLRVDKEKDKEDVVLRILQCSLILPSDDQKVISISLHRVVHGSIKLYIAYDTKEHTKSRLPLYVFQLLLRQKCALGEIALIPHLKAFNFRTKNLAAEILVPGSLKIKQEMQNQILSLSSVLIQHGEFLLSKYYLILALKISLNNGRNKDKVDPKESLHLSFPKIGEIYNNLGHVENYLGNSKQARKYLTEALQLLSRQHGPSHKSVSTCYINLATLDCSNVAECNENLMYSKRALDIDESLETKAIHYSNLGNKHYNEGNFKQAAEYYVKASQIFKETLHLSGTDIKLVGMRLALLQSNLGAIYYLSAKYDIAKVILSTSIDMFLNVTGPKHLHLANSYYNLGLAHFELKELPEAEDCFRRALEIYSQQLEPSHKTIVRVSQNLAAVLEERGQSKEAAKLNKQYGTCRRQEYP